MYNLLQNSFCLHNQLQTKKKLPTGKTQPVGEKPVGAKTQN